MLILGNSVLILPDKIREKTKSEIIIPSPSKSMLTDEGKVIQAGPTCTEVRTGDRVIFQRKGASLWEIDGIEHCCVNESKIQFIYE
jgi:co-chaperonin GroES (HSP10)